LGQFVYRSGSQGAACRQKVARDELNLARCLIGKRAKFARLPAFESARFAISQCAITDAEKCLL